jgi:DNA-binding SARP family transcriptional activator/tetratricopeptide (TPR) repeat protein
MIPVNVLRLLTFGGLALDRPGGPPPPRLRPQRLAILAVLASAADRGMSRERMAGLFWPEADEERARHSLRQALYALRQELGADVIRSGALLSLDGTALSSDVGDFRAALAAGDRARAAALATEPFLLGFYLADSPEFERWVEEERAALTVDATRVVLALTREADVHGDQDVAVEWWRRLTMLDPLSGRFALGYLKALAGRGDRAGALAFARAHENIVRRELEADSDPEIRRLEAELRAIPSPAVVRAAPPRAPDAGVAVDVAPAHTPDEAGTDAKPSGLSIPAGSTAGTNAPRDPGADATPSRAAAIPPPHSPRRPWLVPSVAAAGVLVVVSILTADRWGTALGLRGERRTPTFAVGLIREEGVPDSLRIGGVLTDMLATNLARVAGLSVLANTRLVELMRPGQDTLAVGYLEAARRAGATEIFQGRLLTGPQWSLAMEVQRVDLSTGVVRSGYRVTAGDRYALIDSMTAAIARDLRLGLPGSSVADATTDSPLAYRLYEEGLRAFYQYDQPAARRLMQAALEEDSTFAMAAYYDALLTPGGGPEEIDTRRRALRLAARAPERERLTINADLLAQNMDPAAITVAESLTTRYPNDPRAFALFATALQLSGEWRDAVTAIERAIALDSASEPAGRQNCRFCADLSQLAEVYFWWDSLPAAERVAQHYLQVRPDAHYPWHLLVRSSAARGDVNAFHEYLRRFDQANPSFTTATHVLHFETLAEDYDEIERIVQNALDSPRPSEAAEARWYRSISLRNEGRLVEALRLARVRPLPNDLAEGLIALERGDTRTAIAIFGAHARSDQSMWPPGIRARHEAWNRTLLGMALAAAGDTLAVRALADTVEDLGRRSLYGRDRREHHYLRGMLLVAEQRDAEAVDELRQAIHSPTNGFTRINYELGKALMRLNRPAEAVPVVRAALHGDIDGSNLYMTRTDLHELLAQAFDRLARRDSAAVHYRAVVKAWEHADPLYHARREAARAWLARNREPPTTGTARNR